jgi:hypothetical protein
VEPATAVIAEALILTRGNACQIVAARSLRHSPKIHHYLAPLNAMGLHSPQAIETVDNVMGHLVGNRIAEAVAVILSK